MKNVITTRNFNNKALAYLELKAESDRVDATIKGFKEAFLRFLRKHGVRPEDAPKSRKYESDLYESLFSIGQKTELHEEAIEQFKAVLDSNGMGYLFPQVFQEHTSYAIADTAAETIKTLPMKLKRAYSRTQSTKPKTPALTVKAKKQPATKKEIDAQEAACAG